ncbi:unnamed protein product [Triticum turgidum subsp. durum]|uniref:Protein NLRC3 n=1 Tax=Triticum turgidum subsp. durum TaxID=4567 RepID=A0A9R1BKZ1_TRITD|nr:unnamed protein product [Triticum turgidum subsp. durum]
MESSLLLSSARPLKPSLVAPSSSSFARRRCASFGPKLLFRRLPSLPPRARRWSVAPRAASEAFDGIQSQDKPPGVGGGGARRRAYREEQGEPVARPLGAGAGGITRYIVPAGALLALSFGELLEMLFETRESHASTRCSSQFPNIFKILAGGNRLKARKIICHRTVIWKVVENFLPLKRKDQNSGEPMSSGVTWSFAAGSNLSTSTSIKAQKESKKNLNKFYKELRTLKTVNMAGRQFGDEGLFFLAESLAYNKSAEEVDFSGNAITAAGIEAFDGILQINTALKTLNLSGNIIGDEGAKGAKAISDLLKKNKTIRIVQLSNNTIEYSGFASIADALLENNTLRSLYLKLVAHKPSAFTRDATTNMHIKLWTVDIVFESILLTNCTLYSMYSSGNYGGPLGASSLAKGVVGNKSLRELHLHGNGFGNEGLRVLMSALSAHKGKITVLDIGNNNITSEGSLYVAEFIKVTKSLRWLSLYMDDVGDEGAEKVADALKQNKTISTMDFGGNNIHSRGVTAIAETLKENEVLTTLELSYNPIGPEGVKALCDVLKFNGKLQTLKLGWCQIGVSGAEFIADCLKYNTTLSTLDLRANGLGDDGAICLARSLKIINESLKSLDLGFNEIRDDGAFALAQALKANEDLAVTSLMLANNFFGKFGQVSFLTSFSVYGGTFKVSYYPMVQLVGGWPAFCIVDCN